MECIAKIRDSPTRGHGSTLVELVVSLAITAVLMLGMGSAMMFAAHAMPGANSPTGAVVDAGEALERMMTELQYATAINSRSATMIEFTVADRNADDVPEVIRYEWSGTAGAPLTRQYNGGTAVNVLADVREFNLSHILRTVSVEIPQSNESAETTLTSYSATANLADYAITNTAWYAQCFFPALPGDAIGWRVTRVTLNTKYNGTKTGEARVQLQLPTASNCPSGTVLDEKTLLESALTKNYAVQEFTFSGASGLSPERGLCIVVKWIANSPVCSIQGRNANVTETNLSLATSTNGGGSWSTLASQSLLFTVYGTVTTAGTPLIENTYYLDEVGIELRAGSDSRSVVQTAVTVFNRPEVSL